MTRLVFDIETNGLLNTLDRVHLLVLKDVNTGELSVYRNNATENSIRDGLAKLLAADQVIGHNIIHFDLPALHKVYGITIPEDRVRDTLVLSRLYFADIDRQDCANKKFPKRFIGNHSLEAWGHRLGKAKQGTDITDWSQWTPYMEERCISDVEVNALLARRIDSVTRSGSWAVAEELEFAVARLCHKITTNGCPFDRAAATKLYAELVQVRSQLAEGMRDLFTPWVVFKGEVAPKTDNRRYGLVKGAPYSKVSIVEFNPLSRDHIANRLKALYGWKPTEFTKGGKPKIDEKVLHSLDYPEAKRLAELFLIEKRIGQLAEGSQAWLHLLRDGMIHHSINPNGAVTGRATHSRPNISQVPKVGSRYGTECRSLFGLVQDGLIEAGLWDRWQHGVQVGTDASSLELRCLSHFLHRWDDGAYGQAVIEGNEAAGTDVHSVNTRAIGLEPQKVYLVSGKEQKGRNVGKTFIYAFLYGAGDEKIGVTVGVRDDEIESLIATNSRLVTQARKRLRKDGRKPTPRLVATLVKGALTKARFLAELPALDLLRRTVQKAADRGYLIGLDGRHVAVRSKHAALNTLLQSAGALVCKKWIVETERELLKCGLRHGWDGDFVFLIWAHDELQIACLNGIVAEAVKAASKAAMRTTEQFFQFRVSLDCASKTGKNWADTH